MTTAEVSHNKEISGGRIEGEKDSILLSAKERIEGAWMFKRGVFQQNVDPHVVKTEVKRRES